MLAKRIIPCLDIKNGRVVKGVNFTNLIDAGDPVQIAKFYNDEGADEITFLDITASLEQRSVTLKVLEQTAKEVFIPLTVGGGVKDLDDIYKILSTGCDKVSINSAAVRDPGLIDQAAKRFGTSTIVAAVDVKKSSSGDYEVFINGGRINTAKNACAWLKELEARGAGEILLTSMDTDGTKNGFDTEIISKAWAAVNIPIIASGGAGKMEHFTKAFGAGADACLAASVFHFREIEIQALKQNLKKDGVEVRI